MISSLRLSNKIFLRGNSALCSVSCRGFASVGDSLPGLELMQGFPPKKIALKELGANKNIIILGLPGAFTPT